MTACLGEVTPSAELCNGADDDCNGVVDDGIAPVPCYSGPPGTQGVGRCRGGSRVCSMGMMTACTGEIVPIPEICGNGVDEDCNGMIDDGCGVCSPGATRTCYTGPAGTAGVGICRSGSESCTAMREWSGVCSGQTTPVAELCGNGLDDNCNGMIDEGCMACTPPVTNNTCAAPAGYTIGTTVMGNTNCATANYTASCGFTAGGPDVAYSVAIDGSLRPYTFTMVGAAGFDTVLHLHSSSDCAMADEVACNDDDGMVNRSSFTTGVLPSGTYYLVADGFGMGTTHRGSFTLSSSAGAEINNDACTSSTAAPVVITRNGAYRGTTAGRVQHYTATCGFGTDSAPDVVFQINVPAGRTVTVTTCGSTFDTVLYAATSCGSAMTVACNDDSCGLQSSITLPTAMSATTYFVVLDGYNGASGSYTLNVSGL
jgi:hypothetical protein